MTSHQQRLEALKEGMTGAGVETAILSTGPDLFYLTGYDVKPSERLTVLVVTSADSVLFVPELEAPRVEPGPFEVRAWGETEDPVALATSISKPSKAAVGDHMWSVFLTRFQTRWPDAAWVPASDLTGALRIRKDAGEVALLRSAAEAVDRVMTAIPGKVGFRGRTEKAIGRDLAELLVAEGHDEAMFTIVASGPNGASPHHDPGQRVVEPGDLIVCDIGGRIGGYYSDCTRTFVVGDPAPEPSEAHAAVLAAGEAGKAAIRPGVACQEVDRAARQVITDAGLGDYFIHRTGHGIGLEVHEDPYMVEGNEAVIEPGMAFSVEPGVYLPGRFGVRIEDIVVCDELVADVLNSSTRDLMPVG